MTVSYQAFLKICAGCGEIFDANIECEALHHSESEHAPLLPPRRWRRFKHTTMRARAC